MLSDSRKNQILCNYDFELFNNDIHNMNKTHYSDLTMYTEAKSVFILAEERKASNMNDISETKRSK